MVAILWYERKTCGYGWDKHDTVYNTLHNVARVHHGSDGWTRRRCPDTEASCMGKPRISQSNPLDAAGRRAHFSGPMLGRKPWPGLYENNALFISFSNLYTIAAYAGPQ